nr:histidine-type phosphatase [uncultured Bacteroides sp.]
MRLKQLLICSVIWMYCVPLGAQTSKEEIFSTIEKTGGVYLAYPLDFAQQTPVPKGYKPFYVSHYGRHGSRYLIADRDYQWLIDLFGEAHRESALSDLGEDAYQRLLKVWEEAEGHGGDLTPLGVRQQHGIAERMYAAFPEAFKGNQSISARSTVALRCAMSMVSFGNRLKELNPNLRISYESSLKYMNYLNYHTDESNRFTSSTNGPWVEEYRKFEEVHVNPDRLITSLFKDKRFILKKVNPKEVMWGMYWVASDMQNTETKFSFYDLFQPQELFDLWQCVNYRFYVGNANHAYGKGIVVANAKSLLKNILDSADEAVQKGGIAATLRFGHDGNVIPLVALMQIENCNVAIDDPYELYKVWSDFKVVPMAANVQIVFFRNVKGSADDILVKILHNEHEVHIPVQTNMFPFYKWNDVEDFYRNLLK